MAKLHELLAAEKTPTGAWNQLFEETQKKFGSQSAYFEGHIASETQVRSLPSPPNSMGRSFSGRTPKLFSVIVSCTIARGKTMAGGYIGSYRSPAIPYFGEACV